MQKNYRNARAISADGPEWGSPNSSDSHFGVVRREEAYLERRFGDAFRDYCSRVRRSL